MAENNNNNDGLHRDIAQFVNYQQGRGAFLAPAEDEMVLMAEIIQEHEHGLVLDISSNYLIPPPTAFNDIGGDENDADNLELGIILNLIELVMLSNIMPVSNIYIYLFFLFFFQHCCLLILYSRINSSELSIDYIYILFVLIFFI